VNTDMNGKACMEVFPVCRYSGRPALRIPSQ
jgi:hypothetical protein